MKIKRMLLAGVTVATVSLAGTGLASAATPTDSTAGDGTSLVKKIATKFSLDQSEVEAVFEEERNARRAEMKAGQAERLAQAVTDGKLTQEQADYITKVHAEIEALRGDSSPEDESATVRDQIREKMNALRSWAEENDVDKQYVMGGHGPGGFNGPRGNGERKTESSAS